MSIGQELMQHFKGDISTVKVRKSDLHGQVATEVTVSLMNGKAIEGKFVSENRPGFGGVDFDTRYDVIALMKAKVQSVLDGTAEMEEV